MILFGLSAIMMSSLFFSAQERAAIDNLNISHLSQNTRETEDMPLVLNGILCRPDLDHWIVWINGVRIYSQRPQSIQGWTIIKVNSDSVIVRSKDGEERELRPEQDPDWDEFNASMDENAPEDLEMSEEDQTDSSPEEDSSDTERDDNGVTSEIGAVDVAPETNENIEDMPVSYRLTSQKDEKTSM